MSWINSEKKSTNSAEESAKFGLIIDGKSLDHSLKENMEKSFFELAINCSSVICCRASPKQKALVSVMIMPISGFRVVYLELAVTVLLTSE